MAKRTRQTRSTAGESHPVSRRLSAVCQMHGLLNQQGKPNLSEFHRRLTEGMPPEQQYSYAATRKYLSWMEPPASYLARVAEVFGVRLEWLITEEGEPTKAAQEAADFRRFEKLGDLTDHDIELAFAYLSEPEKEKHAQKRAAIARFSRKLQDARSAAPWMETENRTRLLQAALQFLIGVEDLIERVGRQHPELPYESPGGREYMDWLLLRSSSSTAWRVVWEDAVLDLFTRRVKGLGERTGEFGDRHEPVDWQNAPDPRNYF